MIEVTAEESTDAAAIETLLDGAFGPNRLAKSSYSYRKRVARIWPLCQVAWMEGRLVGTIRYWPIMVGDGATPALLLGPVAVDGDYRTHGIGALLIRSSLAHAKALGHKLVILVGDEPYYGRYGFRPAASWGISMQSENPARVLALPLDETAEMPSGLVQRWRSVRGRGRAALAA